MSYCRFSRDSDVYAYDSWGGDEGQTHISCWVSGKARNKGFKDQVFDDLETFLAYLKELKAGGCLVPGYAIETVEQELKQVP